MKHLIIILSLLVLGCRSDYVTGPDPEPLAAPLSVVGDSVVTISDAALYDRPNRNEIGTVPEGTKGLLLNLRSGWAEVSFINSQLGFVVESSVETIGSDPPPAEGYKLIVVGFSNTRQIIQATPNGYDIGDDFAGMRGKAIQAYGDPGHYSYSDGVEIVRAQLAQNPDASGIAVMIGHRYADPATFEEEGFRHRDVVELLPKVESGSPRYSELEMIENIGLLLDAEAPGLDHYLIALHRYDPATCFRKLGNNTSAAIELMVDEGVRLGYVSELGDSYTLPVVGIADVGQDGCHLSPTGQSKMWDDPTSGLRSLIDFIQ